MKTEIPHCCCLVSPADVGDQHNASGESQVCLNVDCTQMFVDIPAGKHRSVQSHFGVNQREQRASILHMTTSAQTR